MIKSLPPEIINIWVYTCHVSSEKFWIIYCLIVKIILFSDTCVVCEGPPQLPQLNQLTEETWLFAKPPSHTVSFEV